MIETTLPELNVAELMQRVRERAAEMRQQPPATEQRAPATAASIPPEEISWPPPPLVRPAAIDPKSDRLKRDLDQARAATNAPKWVPKAFRRFFRKQGAYNRLIIGSLNTVAKTNAEIASRFEHLWRSVEVQHDAATALAAARKADLAWIRAADDAITCLRSRVESLDRELSHTYKQVADRLTTETADLALTVDELSDQVARLDKHATGQNEQLSRYDARLRGYDEQLAEFQVADRHLRLDFERAAEHLRNLQGQTDQLVARQGLVDALSERTTQYRKELDAAAEHLRNLQAQVDRAGEHLRNLQGEADRSSAALDATTAELRGVVDKTYGVRGDLDRAGEHLRNLQGSFDRELANRTNVDQALARLDERLTSEGSYIKAELGLQRSLLSTSKASTASGKSTKARSPHIDHRLDAFYLDFENRFRGKRAEIKERLRFYLPVVTSANTQPTADRPLLDLGCGRGEWLELLAEATIPARGIDANRAMCSYCLERKLDVTEADVIEHLRSLKDSSVAAVTGFHIIEHLPLDVLLELFAQTLRVLRPGGLAIFESPNCFNYAVGSCYFNVDPTHRNPIFPETAEFMLANTGFEKVRLEYLSPVANSPLDDNTSASRYLKERFFGPQDFGVIGYRPMRR